MEDDMIVGHLSMDYREIRNGEYVLGKDGNPTIKKYDVDVTRRHLSVLMTLMMNREKVVMMENITNVRESQEKDKMLRQLYELLGLKN